MKKRDTQHSNSNRQAQQTTMDEDTEGLPVIRPWWRASIWEASNIGCALRAGMARDAKPLCSEPRHRSWKRWRCG